MGMCSKAEGSTAHLDVVKQFLDSSHKALGLEGDAELLALLAGAVSPGGHARPLLHITRADLYPHRHPLNAKHAGERCSSSPLKVANPNNRAPRLYSKQLMMGI